MGRLRCRALQQEEEAKEEEEAKKEEPKKDDSDSSSSSSEDSESDCEEGGHTRLTQYSLPPNIHPVRSASKKTKLARAAIVPTMTSIIPDHSYSHSDHSYHTQRRPASSSSNENGVDCLLTPSDSGTITDSDFDLTMK